MAERLQTPVHLASLRPGTFLAAVESAACCTMGRGSQAEARLGSSRHAELILVNTALVGFADDVGAIVAAARVAGRPG